MSAVISILIGYFLGTISFAQLFASHKDVNLRTSGTGNLGGTNAILTMGRRIGVTVMLLDIFKGFIAVWLAWAVCRDFAYAGLVSGSAAVFGHVFPYYLKFKGGKGHATLIGAGLAMNIVFVCQFQKNYWGTVQQFTPILHYVLKVVKILMWEYLVPFL